MVVATWYVPEQHGGGSDEPSLSRPVSKLPGTVTLGTGRVGKVVREYIWTWVQVLTLLANICPYGKTMTM